MYGILEIKQIEMNHVELCELINKLRQEENRKELRQDNLLAKIDKEVETLKALGLNNALNFKGSDYKDSSGKTNRTYIMNRNGILQIASSESIYVRAKIIEYIEALETRLQTIQQQQIISEKDKQIKRLESLIGLRTKDKFQYGKIIKRHLGIRKANNDYENIKQLFFYELGVQCWEDITYDRKNVVLLQDICESYKPNYQLSLF